MEKPVEAIKVLQDAAKWDLVMNENDALDVLEYIKHLEQIIDIIESASQHIDDRNMNPVFEVTPECDWREGNKGIIHCVKESIIE